MLIHANIVCKMGGLPVRALYHIDDNYQEQGQPFLHALKKEILFSIICI
jgi:hypothetical protein